MAKQAEKAEKAAPKKRATRKRKAAEAKSRGLEARDVTGGRATAELERLERRIDEASGTVIGRYRDPIGGRWLVVAALPIDALEPTPFQRDVSQPHATRLAGVIGQMELFLDPLIAVPAPDGGFWVPNGSHRLAAMRQLGARAVIALITPEEAVAYRILALNTEKAHSLRERSLEVVRMYRGLAELSRDPESRYVLEFEDPALATLGFAYETNGRFAGAAYHPILKRVDAFLDLSLPKALAVREERAATLLAVDEVVAERIAELKKRGFQSPYLRNFVVARIRPWHPRSKSIPGFDEAMEKMRKSAEKMDTGRVRTDQVSAAGGAAEE